jgi:hypothetical protein
MTDDEISLQFATYAEKKLDWPRRDSIVRRSANAFVAIGYALLAIHVEIRRLNSDRSQWYREVLEVLTQAKDGDASLRSEQPAAAPDGQEGDEPRVCRACGKPGVLVVCTEGDGPLTREQWLKHHDALYYESGEYGANKTNAACWADSQMEHRFGPCPEESAAAPSQQEGEDG